jgi:hypothetical protein
MATAGTKARPIQRNPKINSHNNLFLIYTFPICHTLSIPYRPWPPQTYTFRIVGIPDPVILWFLPETKLSEVQQTIERCQIILPRNAFHFIGECQRLDTNEQLKQLGLAPGEVLVVQSGSKRALQSDSDAPTVCAYGNVDYARALLEGEPPPETRHGRWRKQLIADPNAFERVLDEFGEGETCTEALC